MSPEGGDVFWVWTRIRTFLLDTPTIPVTYAFGGVIAAPVSVLTTDTSPVSVPMCAFLISLGVYILGAILFFLSLCLFCIWAPSKIIHHKHREAYLGDSVTLYDSIGEIDGEPAPNRQEWLRNRRFAWNTANENQVRKRWTILSFMVLALGALFAASVTFLIILALSLL